MSFAMWGLLDTKEPLLITLAIILGLNLGHDLMYGPQAAYFSELFGTRVRYSGASLGYQFAAVFAGGMAPLVATALLAAQGGEPTLVAVYMAIMAALSVVGALVAPETAHDDIHAADEREREIVYTGRRLPVGERVREPERELARTER
jgi:MFS family permease